MSTITYALAHFSSDAETVYVNEVVGMPYLRVSRRCRELEQAQFYTRDVAEQMVDLLFEADENIPWRVVRVELSVVGVL